MPIATNERMHSTAKIEEPLHSIELPYQIRRVECSPYEWSHNVICIAFDGKVAIGVTKFQVCTCLLSVVEASQASRDSQLYFISSTDVYFLKKVQTT